MRLRPKWIFKKALWRGRSPYFFLMFFSVGLGLLLGFQNCGQIKIAPLKDQLPSSIIITPPTSSHFKIPEPPDYQMRAAFFVDMSASMSTVECPDSIDPTTNPKAVNTCVNGSLGSDPFMHRLNIIDEWLDEAEEYIELRGLAPSKFKAILIPFSGPLQRFNQYLTDVSMFTIPNVTLNGQPYVFKLHQKQFTSISEIRKTVDSLRTLQYSFTKYKPDISNLRKPLLMEQSNYDPTSLANPIALTSAMAPQYIRTSVPAPAMTVLKDSLRTELNTLKQNGTLNKTRFEIVFLSDGIPRPLPRDLKKGANLVWGLKEVTRPWGCWNDVNPTFSCEISGVNLGPGGLKCAEKCGDSFFEYLSRVSPTERGPITNLDGFSQTCQTCFRELEDYHASQDTKRDYPESFLRDARSYWGDYSLNEPNAVLTYLRQTKSLLNSYPEASYRMSFLRFENQDPDFAPTEEDLSSDINWITKATDFFKSQIRYSSISSPNKPFSLFPNTSISESYKISRMFILNPNARVNSAGVLSVDSDGDGLFDYEETQIGKNPNSPRTHGVCLDSIVFYYGGCISDGCDKNLDQDGDGLNECEEKTIGTSDKDFDTDGDGIPDSLEVIYGFNPLMNDRERDSRGDGHSNLSNFIRGLGPLTSASNVPPRNLISFNLKQSSFVTLLNSFGQTVYVPTYIIQILNLPIMETLGSIHPLPLYWDNSHSSQSLWSPPLIAPQLNPHENNLIFLIRVENTQSTGDGYWLFHYLKTPYTDLSLRIPFDLQDFNIMSNWKDPEGTFE